MTSGKPVNSYVFNTGLPDDPAATPPDWPANGVIQNLYPAQVRANAQAWAALIEGAPAADFVRDHDGLSDTLLASENIQAGLWTSLDEWEIGFVWSPKFADNPLARVNSHPPAKFSGDKYLLARPSSYHAGVVNAVYCDGHGKPVNQEIDYRVLAQLMTSWGKEAAWPGEQDGKKQYITPNDW